MFILPSEDLKEGDSKKIVLKSYEEGVSLSFTRVDLDYRAALKGQQ